MITNSFLVDRYLSQFEVLFQSGMWVLSPKVLQDFMKRGESITDYISRHITGDWGDISDKDKKRNEVALISEGDIIFSSYVHTMKDKTSRTIWIMTNKSRSSTVVMFLDECFDIIESSGVYSFVNE